MHCKLKNPFTNRNMLIDIQAGNIVSKKPIYQFYSNIGKSVCQPSKSEHTNSIYLLAKSSSLA